MFICCYANLYNFDCNIHNICWSTDEIQTDTQIANKKNEEGKHQNIKTHNNSKNGDGFGCVVVNIIDLYKTKYVNKYGNLAYAYFWVIVF